MNCINRVHVIRVLITGVNIEMAKNAISEGLSTDLIVKLTGLSV